MEETTTTAEEEVAPPEEDTVKFSVSTNEMMSFADDVLFELAKSKGLEVKYDKSIIEFSATQTVLNEIAEEYRAKMNEQFSEDNAEEGSTLKKIIISDDYKNVDFYVLDGFKNSTDSLAVLLIAQPMCELQVLTGTSADKVKYTQNTIDYNTNEVIQTNTMPDDLKAE